jgi:hypothetical protein
MADKRRNLGANLGVPLMQKGKVNYQKGNNPNCAHRIVEVVVNTFRLT